jgi:hypothetical protein
MREAGPIFSFLLNKFLFNKNKKMRGFIFILLFLFVCEKQKKK